MDRDIFDVDRVARCCIQEALPDGRIVPFCAYNTLYRFVPDHRPVPGGAVGRREPIPVALDPPGPR
jgi:hypothetical protein